MPRVTLTEVYEHAEGRVFRAGDHVLPEDVVAGARAAGKVAEATADKPAATTASRRPAKAKRKPATKAKRG